MKNSINFLLAMVVALVLNAPVSAIQADRILVSPLNTPTLQSGYGIYPNVLLLISNDIINALNKQSRFDVLDLNSADALISENGLSKKYSKFLSDYKENRVLDYRTCNLLAERVGIDRILLVSGGFDLQNMILKKSLLTKLGLTNIFGRIGFSEADPIQSYYRLNVVAALVDAQSGVVLFEKIYKKNIKSSSFENPATSFAQNVIPMEGLKDFSDKISRNVSASVLRAINKSGYRNVKSNIIPTSSLNKKSKDGVMTKDGHFYSENDAFLKKNRKDSFKFWIKERAEL